MINNNSVRDANLDADLINSQLSDCIDYCFNDAKLPLEALIHKSYFNEHPTDVGHNERLEFLGDAVLDLIMAEVLMQMMPLAPEGQLTQSRAALVNEDSLAQIAQNLNLGSMIFLGKGEEKNNGRQKPSILSDAVEAIVGAVYLDSDYSTTKDVVLAWFAPMLNEVVLRENVSDAKTQLQEELQGLGYTTPSYHVVGSTGPDHDKTFEVEIEVDEQPLARGIGRSKKEAEKQAAQNALAALKEKL